MLFCWQITTFASGSSTSAPLLRHDMLLPVILARRVAVASFQPFCLQPADQDSGRTPREDFKGNIIDLIPSPRIEDALQTISIQSDTKEHDYVYETVCGSGRECETTLL